MSSVIPDNPKEKSGSRVSRNWMGNAAVLLAVVVVVALAFTIVAVFPAAPPDSPLVGTYQRSDLRTLTLYKGGVAAYDWAYPNWSEVGPEEWKLTGDTLRVGKVDRYKVEEKKLVGTRGPGDVWVKQEVTDHPGLVGTYTEGQYTLTLEKDNTAVFRRAALAAPIGPEYDWWVEYDCVMFAAAGIDPWKGQGTASFQSKGDKLIEFGPNGHFDWVKQ